MTSGSGTGSRQRGVVRGIRSPARLSIAVLGGLTIACAGHEVRLPSRKARSILAYLALHDAGSERRERIAGLLWGDTTEAKARTSLRQALFDIRDALAPHGEAPLQAGRQDLTLARDAVELDLAAILDELDGGTVRDSLTAHPRLAESLLAGYEDLSPMFGDWLATARRAAHDKLLRRLEQGYEATGLTRRQRRRMADAAVLLDPLHEGACRAAMRLAAEDGEIGVALRAYAALYDGLGDELDMEPSLATQELVAAIKQGRIEARPDAAGAAAPATHGMTHGITPAVPPIAMLPTSGPPTVAVLPLRSIGPDPVPGYFAEGVVEDTVCILATLREPIVISSNSTRGFTGPDVNLLEIRRVLGVQYVVSGTLRTAGTRVRLAVELAEAATGAVLWGSTYDVTTPTLFDAQADIATSIARTLVPQLRDAELRRSRRQRPEELSAYHLMLQARDLMFRLERDTFENAGELLRRAMALDPGYAATHATAANWYSLRIGQGWSADPVADAQALEALAHTATGLDSTNGRALAILGHNRTILRREHDAALALLDRALDASPNDAETLMWSSPTHAYGGEPAEAIRRAERAIALSPQDPFLFRYEHFLCIAHYAADEFDAAIHWGTRSLGKNPHYTSNIRMTTAALVAAGRAGEARPLVETMKALQPSFRVAPLVSHQAFRDATRREQYGERLIAAGLPR